MTSLNHISYCPSSAFDIYAKRKKLSKSVFAFYNGQCISAEVYGTPTKEYALSIAFESFRNNNIDVGVRSCTPHGTVVVKLVPDDELINNACVGGEVIRRLTCVEKQKIHSIMNQYEAN